MTSPGIVQFCFDRRTSSALTAGPRKRAGDAEKHFSLKETLCHPEATAAQLILKLLQAFEYCQQNRLKEKVKNKKAAERSSINH